MERKSNAMMFEIISNGFLTDAAQQFMAKLPTVDDLIPPLRVEELAALIEGKAVPSKNLAAQLMQSAQQQKQLEE
jgi:hypothetical protein